MKKWTAQNTASLEAKHVKILKPEAKVLANIKICYPDAFYDRILTQFINLIHIFKVSYVEPRESTAIE